MEQQVELVTNLKNSSIVSRIVKKTTSKRTHCGRRFQHKKNGKGRFEDFVDDYGLGARKERDRLVE